MDSFRVSSFKMCFLTLKFQRLYTYGEHVDIHNICLFPKNVLQTCLGKSANFKFIKGHLWTLVENVEHFNEK